MVAPLPSTEVNVAPMIRNWKPSSLLTPNVHAPAVGMYSLPTPFVTNQSSSPVVVIVPGRQGRWRSCPRRRPRSDS